MKISQSIDYEKYYLYSLIAHSTAIEGSTLTEMEAQLLFDEGLTANGRTARLLMNNIQFTYNLFPAKIFKEDRDDYILSLRQSQDADTNQPFLDFMALQLQKSLSLEIDKFNDSRKKEFNLMF